MSFHLLLNSDWICSEWDHFIFFPIKCWFSNGNCSWYIQAIDDQKPPANCSETPAMGKLSLWVKNGLMAKNIEVIVFHTYAFFGRLKWIPSLRTTQYNQCHICNILHFRQKSKVLWHILAKAGLYFFLTSILLLHRICPWLAPCSERWFDSTFHDETVCWIVKPQARDNKHHKHMFVYSPAGAEHVDVVL